MKSCNYRPFHLVQKVHTKSWNLWTEAYNVEFSQRTVTPSSAKYDDLQVGINFYYAFHALRK